MSQERTFVSFDWAVKHLLRNKADYAILEGFLTTLLGKEIKIKKLVGNENDKGSEDGKYTRVDILAEMADSGTEASVLAIIELQFTREIGYFRRMLLGYGKAIAESFGKEMPYSMVKNVYSVNVIYFDLNSGEDYICRGTTTFRGLHYNDELKLSPTQKTDYPEYYLLNVNCFKDIIQSKMDEWMYYLRNSEIKPEFNAPGLDVANKKLEYSRLSLEDKHKYDCSQTG